MNKNKKIAIIGGGITGLTTALALNKLGISATIYERTPEIKTVGAGIWMAPNAMKIFDWLGIGDEVRQNGSILQQVDISNKQLVPIRPSKEGFIKDSQGNGITSIHRAKLQHILCKHLSLDQLILDAAYQSHEEKDGKVHIQFQGSSVSAHLLLGADGIHSQVRQQLFPNSSIRYSGQTCWRGVSTLR